MLNGYSLRNGTNTRDMVRDMPQGISRTADHGLDQTHTWASTYWGGTLFCLIADVAIREKAGNRKGLQDALRRILSAWGTIDQEWPISRALAVGDRATGTSVLTDLYGKMGQQPDPVDLDMLWTQLGVDARDGSIVFDNHAPLTRIRHSITSPGLHPAVDWKYPVK